MNTFSASGSGGISMQRFRTQHEELAGSIKVQNFLIIDVNIGFSRKIIYPIITYTELVNRNLSFRMKKFEDN
jgi:hypothetical protein